MFFGAMGLATALFNMQAISAITLKYGSAVALWTIVYASIAAPLFGYFITSFAIRTGFGVNLLARRVLGGRGSALFSASFALTALVFFTAEANIMATALEGVFRDFPIALARVGVAMLMVPLLWHGMRFLARFQLATFVLYGVLLVYALAVSRPWQASASQWLKYQPSEMQPFMPSLLDSFGIINGLIFIVALVTADYARYVHRRELRPGRIWVGVVFEVFSYCVIGLLGLWFATRYREADPARYFITMLGSGGLVLSLVTQLRINLANMYSGSIAVASLIRQLSGLRTDYRAIISLFGIVASAALVFDLTAYILSAVRMIGIFMISFALIALGDVYLFRPSSDTVADSNPVALGASLVSTALGVTCANGALGPLLAGAASFVAGLSGIALYGLAQSAARRPVIRRVS
jgi:purine-cytosine permease-like protein